MWKSIKLCDIPIASKKLDFSSSNFKKKKKKKAEFYFKFFLFQTLNLLEYKSALMEPGPII
jgi:hypothetical protein